MTVVNTFEQAIELAFAINGQAMSEAEQELERTRKVMLKNAEDYYASIAQYGEQFSRNREALSARYLEEYGKMLQGKTDLDERQVMLMVEIERQKLGKLLSDVEDSNTQMLRDVEAFHDQEVADREKTVDQVAKGEEGVAEIIEDAKDPLKAKPDEGDTKKSELMASMDKGRAFLSSIGFPLGAMTIMDLAKFTLAVYDKHLKETRVDFQLAAASGRLLRGTPYDMTAYTESIRQTKMRFPTIKEEIDQIAVSLQQAIPGMTTWELEGVLRGVLALHFFTGESMANLAQEMGSMHRRLGVSVDQLAAQLLQAVSLGRFYAETNKLNLDIPKFVQNVAGLADQNRLWNLGMTDAGAWVFRFGKELDKGIVSLQDVATIALGYSKQGPTQTAFWGQQALQAIQNRPGFAELQSVLSQAHGDAFTMDLMVRTIGQKSAGGYAELQRMGIRVNPAQREVLEHQLQLAMMAGLDMIIPHGDPSTEMALRQEMEETQNWLPKLPIGVAAQAMAAQRGAGAMPTTEEMKAKLKNYTDDHIEFEKRTLGVMQITESIVDQGFTVMVYTAVSWWGKLFGTDAQAEQRTIEHGKDIAAITAIESGAGTPEQIARAEHLITTPVQQQIEAGFSPFVSPFDPFRPEHILDQQRRAQEAIEARDIARGTHPDQMFIDIVGDLISFPDKLGQALNGTSGIRE